MTDSYDADQLERDLNTTIVQYRRWLKNRDSWAGFGDDRQSARLQGLADDAAGVIRELTAALQQQGGDVEFEGKVARLDGASFETYAYFEDGRLLVADDGDEEWVVDLTHITRRTDGVGMDFPDNDGSLLVFLPGDPDAFYRALAEAQGT
jgi:hypothetical protein